MAIKTLPGIQTQVTFNTPLDLKEQTLQKARAEGITLKALLTMAMREYINNNLHVTLLAKEDYFDPVFASPKVIKQANVLGKLLTSKKL